MDNIKDRQFYWEVKQFFNGKPENNVPPQPKPSLKDAVSGVLKENNPYKQTNFSNNQTSVNAAQNAMKDLGAMDAANKPSCVAYTKNAIKNPFNLNEGFWDYANPKTSMAAPGALEVEDRRKQARANSTQQNFGSPTAPRTTEQQQLERDAVSGKPGTQKQAYYSNAPLVQDSIDKYKEQNTVQQPVNTDNRSFFQKAADQANNPEKYNLGVVGKISANVANFVGGLAGQNIKARESTGTASTDKSGNTVFNPTPVQTQTPKPASAPAPVQGQSQAPDAPTKAPVQGQSQTPPVQNQTQPQSMPAKNQPTPAPAPQRGPGGGIIAPPVALDKASENPEAYEGMDDRITLGQVPMGGEVAGPNGIQKPGAQANSSYFESLKKSITQSFPQNSQSTPSAGQYRNRGSSNMGMATRPNRPEAMTLQSAMAQQNQQATRSALGQMGAVEGAPNTMTNSSSGFRGSVLPPAGQLTSMGTQKENEFKFAKGSRLA